MAAGKLLSNFQCPNCGSAVSLRATGISLSVSCKNCRSIIGVENENYKILSQFEASKTVTPLIPIGTRGEIESILFEVIGFLERTDHLGYHPWREYLLFNPYHGFRWLVEAKGHWSYVTMIKKTVFQKNSSGEIDYQGRSYSLFDEGSAKVRYVWGEFYWRIKRNQELVTKDYVSPPYMLSLEQENSEIVWSQAIYQKAEFIQKTFNIQQVMPYSIGIAPHQPCFWGTVWDEVKWVSLCFLIVLTLIHCFLNSLNTQSLSHTQSATYIALPKGAVPSKGAFGIQPIREKDVLNSEIETPTFELKNNFTGLEVGLWADISNAWVASTFELVNCDTDETIPLESEVANYNGYDSDGYWSEGSNRVSNTISSVPKGRYFLRADIDADPALKKFDYQIMIKDGIIPLFNLILALFLVLCIPIFAYWRKWSFEVERWSESDYSPFSTGED